MHNNYKSRTYNDSNMDFNLETLGLLANIKPFLCWLYGNETKKFMLIVSNFENG